MPSSAVARTPASQAAGSWRSTGRAEEKTIWEVLFFRSRLPIPDQMASGHSQAAGSRYRFDHLKRTGEDGDIQPGSDGPPPPAAAVEQQAQLGKQHPQVGFTWASFETRGERLGSVMRGTFMRGLAGSPSLSS